MWRSRTRGGLVAGALHDELCSSIARSRLPPHAVNAQRTRSSARVWLLARQRYLLPLFGTTLSALVLVILALFETVTRGRLTDNVFGLGFSGSRGFESFAWEADRVRFILADGLGPVRLLVAVALLVTIWRGRLTLYELSLACSLPILAVILTDRGAFSNQLLDVQVLTIIVLGAGW